jgi:putative transposase
VGFAGQELTFRPDNCLLSTGLVRDPVSETHLRAMLRESVTHYNAGRPHKMLGLGVPSPPALASLVPQSESRHRLPAGTLVHAKSVLGGLHHEYTFAAAVA